MNRNNLIGLIVVIIVIAGIFVYIDFFAPSPISPESPATSPPNNQNNFGSASDEEVVAKQTIVLGLNETQKIVDTEITPWAVLEDSRCATGHYCIQAGRVVAGVRVVSSTRDSSVEMKPDDKIYTPNFTLTLKDVSPYPIADHKTLDNEYRFTFEIAPTSLPLGPKPVGHCYIGGCSGQICSDNPHAVSTCEYRQEYACYAKAKCERQSDSRCGWTETPEYKSCLLNASNSTL